MNTRLEDEDLLEWEDGFDDEGFEDEDWQAFDDEYEAQPRSPGPEDHAHPVRAGPSAGREVSAARRTSACRQWAPPMNAVVHPVRTVATPRQGRPKPAEPRYSPQWFVGRQVINAERYLAGLAPFREDEFGTDAQSPSPAHIRAANRLIVEVRGRLAKDIADLHKLGRATIDAAGGSDFGGLLTLKDRIYAQTNEAERMLAFYRGIFDQRTTRFGHQLLPIDRIARDCYQAVWTGLGAARSIPSPPPFSYIEDGNGPATFRRGVRLSTLGKRPNPFPLVKVPQHRLQNPWTLGAVPHEVAHNLQNDLGMWSVVPKRIEAALSGKVPESAVDTWMKWHKETYADLAGVLLIGPAYVESLIDVVAKRPRATAAFNPDGVHPTPLVRVPINCQLLRQIGFRAEADDLEKTWNRIYPQGLRKAFPDEFRQSFDRACMLVVKAICFQQESAYGGKALAEVIKFTRKDVTMVNEAADRLVRGENTGVLPERFLISAARTAIRTHKTQALNISRNFYLALGRA